MGPVLSPPPGCVLPAHPACAQGPPTGRLLTWEGAVLRAARGYEVQGYVGGPADVLVREGPAGPRVALAHHALANEVDPAHDEE